MISMNPYKWVTGLYSKEVIYEYEGRSRIEMPPHVYGVAEDAYRAMMTEKDNQCIIISGESGAGLTIFFDQKLREQSFLCSLRNENFH